MCIFHTTNIYTACLYHLYHILVKCVHVTTLHQGVPFMGRLQIEPPLTFQMALAYFCDISCLLCNNVCGALLITYFQQWYFTPQ